MVITEIIMMQIVAMRVHCQEGSMDLDQAQCLHSIVYLPELEQQQRWVDCGYARMHECNYLQLYTS